MADIKLTSITAPGLNISNYGEHIDQQFTNIDSNFKKIVGTDFLKGNAGDSVQIIEIKFEKNNNNLTGLYLNGTNLTYDAIYNLVRKAILDGLNEFDSNRNQVLNPINGINWDDNLAIFNNITIVYRISEETGQKNVISSLYYTFHDARFSKIQYDNSADYKGIVDMSCVVSTQSRNNRVLFKKLNTFPTLYYNEDIRDAQNNYGTFCWIINGNKTEIPAVGPRGETGNMGTVYLVKVSDSLNSNYKFIRQVFYIDGSETGKWENIEDFIANCEDRKIYFGEGSCVLALKEVDSDNISYENRLWISPVHVDNKESIIRYYAYCDESNSVLGVFNTDQLLHSMSDIYKSGNLFGLFVPITGVEDNKQAAHMIYALPDVEGGNIYNHLYMAPVKDIHQKPWYTKWNDNGSDYNGSLGLYDTEKSVMSFLYHNVIADNNLTVNGAIKFKDNLSINNVDNDGVNIDILAGKYLKISCPKNNALDWPIQLTNTVVDGNLLVTNTLDTSSLNTDNINTDNINVLNNANISNNINCDGNINCNGNINANIIDSVGNTTLGNGLFEINVPEKTVRLNTNTSVLSNGDDFIQLHSGSSVKEQEYNISHTTNSYEKLNGCKSVVAVASASQNSFIDFFRTPVNYYNRSQENFIDSSYKNDIEIPFTDEYEIWRRNNDADELDGLKLKFNRNITTLFTVSGRNVFSNPWLAAKTWIEPKLKSASLEITLKIYSKNNTLIREIPIDKKIEISNGNSIFTMKDEDIYKNDSDAENNGYGDTAVCVFSTPLSITEYEYNPAAEDDVYLIKLSFNGNIKFNRNAAKNEDYEKFKNWRDIKILGIFSSKKTSSASLSIKKRLSSLPGQDINKMKPLEDVQSNQEKLLNDLIKPGDYNDLRYFDSTGNLQSLIEVYEKSNGQNPNQCHIYSDGIIFSRGQSFLTLYTDKITPGGSNNSIDDLRIKVYKETTYNAADKKENESAAYLFLDMSVFDILKHFHESHKDVKFGNQSDIDGYKFKISDYEKSETVWGSALSNRIYNINRTLDETDEVRSDRMQINKILNIGGILNQTTITMPKYLLKGKMNIVPITIEGENITVVINNDENIKTISDGNNKHTISYNGGEYNKSFYCTITDGDKKTYDFTGNVIDDFNSNNKIDINIPYPIANPWSIEYDNKVIQLDYKTTDGIITEFTANAIAKGDTEIYIKYNDGQRQFNYKLGKIVVNEIKLDDITTTPPLTGGGDTPITPTPGKPGQEIEPNPGDKLLDDDNII